jgi:hypothetical protein
MTGEATMTIGCEGLRCLGSELYVLAHAFQLRENFGEEAGLRVDPQHGAAGKKKIFVSLSSM